jgi:hypothetical protein
LKDGSLCKACGGPDLPVPTSPPQPCCPKNAAPSSCRGQYHCAASTNTCVL